MLHQHIKKESILISKNSVRVKQGKNEYLLWNAGAFSPEIMFKRKIENFLNDTSN